MRRVAFVSVVISTTAVIVSVLALPMLYSYVQNLQSTVISETDFCKVESPILFHKNPAFSPVLVT